MVTRVRMVAVALIAGAALSACEGSQDLVGPQPEEAPPSKFETVITGSSNLYSFDATPVADVTYGMLHGTVRFWNSQITSVSAGTFSGNSATVDPGASITVSGNWQIGPVTNTGYCPGCIIQIYVAWVPDAAASGATPRNKGLWSGQTYSTNPNPGASGSYSWTTNAPTQAGVYYIGRGQTLHYSYQWYTQGGYGTSTSGSISPAASFQIVVPDPTAPAITPALSGTMGDNGWYTSDVDVSWTVEDPESDISATSGCDAMTVTTDTNGATFTCTATSFGGTSSASVTVMRDATDPTVAYAGNAGTYDVSEAVAISCTASDAMSGIASDSCAPVVGDAFSFGLGTHSFSATATDNAGNGASASTSFTVETSFGGVCALVEEFVTKKGVANSLCQKLANAERQAARGKTKARDGMLGAFLNELDAQRGKAVPEAYYGMLYDFASALMN